MKKKLITAQHPTRVYTCHIPAKDQPWTLNWDQAGMILFLKDLISVPADMFESHICPTVLHTTLISWIYDYSFNTSTSKSHSSVSLCIGEGPEYMPFPDFRPVPRAHISNHKRACTQAFLLRKAELGFFHFLEIVTGWLVPSAGQKIPVQPGWYLPPQKIPLAENRFLQAGNGAENTKETFWQCFTHSIDGLDEVGTVNMAYNPLCDWKC